MIIPCPSCKTKFKIKEELFGDKQLIKFQCAKCKHIFQFDRETGKPAEEAGAARPSKPQPEAMVAAMEAMKATAQAPKKAKAPEKALEDRPTTEFNKADLERPTTELVKKDSVKVEYEESYESFEPEKEAAPPEPEPAGQADETKLAETEQEAAIAEDVIEEAAPPEPEPAGQADETESVETEQEAAIAEDVIEEAAPPEPEPAGQADETESVETEQEAAIAEDVIEEAAPPEGAEKAREAVAEKEARAEEAGEAEEAQPAQPVPPEVEEKAEAVTAAAEAARAEAGGGEPIEESPMESEQAAAQAVARPAPETAEAQATADEAARASRADSTRNILTSGPYILELEDMLDDDPLQKASGRSRAVGITAILILLVCAVIYILIVWKNNWDFAALFTNPGDAIAIATGQKTKLLIAPDAKGLETALTRVYTTQTANDIRILVAEGEVLNTSVFAKKQIRLYLELLNIGGAVVATMEVPSGITLLAEREIQEKTFSGLTMHLEIERKTADVWVVNSNRKVSFQAFFPDPPSGADDPDRFTVRATAISAVNALAK